MVSAVITIFAAISIPGLVILIVAVRRAPVGFEDANGFHVVEEHSSAEAVVGATVSAN